MAQLNFTLYKLLKNHWSCLKGDFNLNFEADLEIEEALFQEAGVLL